MKGCPIAKVLTFWIPLKIEKRDYPDSFQVAQMVKCLPALRETRVRSLAQENALEKEMVTHSRTLAWKIPWMEEPGRLSSSVLKFLYSPTLTSIHDYWKNHSLDPCQQSNVSVF